MGWLVTFVSIGLAAGSPMDVQTLVSQAGQHAALQEKALEHVAVTTTARQEEVDGKGKVQHVSEIVAKSTPVDDHKKYEIVKAFEDQHDISEQESKQMRMAVHGSDKPGEGRIDNPFLPSEQGKYHFWWIGPDAQHPGWSRVGFGPAGKPDVNLVAGEAVIDDQGYLRHIEDKPSRNPSHMEEMHMALEYATPSPWGPLRTEMTVEGKGRIFYFFHRQVRGSVRYAYELPPQASAAPAQPANAAPTPAASPR